MQECAKLESGSQILQRRIASSEKIISDFTQEKEELNEKLANATGENNRLQTRLETMKEAYEKEINTLRSDLALSRSESTDKLAGLKLVLTDEQEKAKRLEQRCIEVQEHAKQRINELAEELEKRVKPSWTTADLVRELQTVCAMVGRNGKFNNTFDHCGY